MRVIGHRSGRFLGYVHLQVASRVYVLPVESRPLTLDDGTILEPGFFDAGSGHFGIRVDPDASEADVQQTIETASAEAARHLSRKLLN